MTRYSIFLFLCLSFCCLGYTAPPRENDVRYLVYTENYNFWNHRENDIRQFFSCIDLVKERLRQRFGKSFIQYPFPRNMLRLQTTINNLIRNLTAADVYAILEEGNDVIVSFFLGRFEVFPDVVNLRLTTELPNLHLIPVEDLSQRTLSAIPIDVLIKIVTSRIEMGLLRHRWLLFIALPETFWWAPDVQFNCTILNVFAPLTLGSLAEWKRDKLATGKASPISTAKFNYPVELYLDTLLNVNSEHFNNLFHQAMFPGGLCSLTTNLKYLCFHLQSLVHNYILSRESDISLLTVIGQAYNQVRARVSGLAVAFPDDAEVQSLSLAYDTCYSATVFQHLHDEDSIYHHVLEEHLFPDSCVLASLNDLKMLLEFPKDSIHYEQFDQTRKSFVFFPIFMLISPNVQPGHDMESYIQTVANTISHGHIAAAEFENETGLYLNFRHLFQHCSAAVQPIIIAFLKRKDISVFHNPYNDISGILLLSSSKSDVMFLERGLFIDSVNRKPLVIELMEDFDELDKKISNCANYGLNQTGNSKRCNFTLTFPLYKPLKMKLSTKSFNQSTIRLCIKNDTVSLHELTDEHELMDVVYARYHYWAFRHWNTNESSNHTDRPKIKVPAKLKTLRHFQQHEPDATNRLEVVDCDIHDNYPPELVFIETVLEGLGLYLMNPASNWEVIFSNSVNISGLGPVRDVLYMFGTTIVQPQVKTFIFVEAQQGFVPAPFLSPLLMPFIAAWIVLCWKVNCPLPWQFGNKYLEFLLYGRDEESDEKTNGLIREMYAPHLKFLDQLHEFLITDPSQELFFPIHFRPHKMFAIPQPYPAPVEPFIIEPYALQLEASHANFYCNRTYTITRKKRHMNYLYAYLRSALYAGRLEFQRHLRLFFNADFNPNLTYTKLLPFFKTESIDQEYVEALLSCIIVSDVPIKNDMPDALTEVISAKELLFDLIRTFDRHHLERFLWFITGTSRPSLKGFLRQSIEFKIVEESDLGFSTAHTCFFSVRWHVNRESVKETVYKLYTSFLNASGYMELE